MLRYLTTDAQIVGVVTWVGLLVTVAGFWTAIVQIRQVRTAAEAASEAVTRLTLVVRSQEQSARIEDALGHLKSAQGMIKLNNMEAAEAYLSVGWTSLIAARELTVDQEDRMLISECVLSTRRLLDEVSAPSSHRALSAKALTARHLSLARTLDGLGHLSARLTANLSGIGVDS